MNINNKKAIFVGECMIELNGDISSLRNSNSICKLTLAVTLTTQQFILID